MMLSRNERGGFYCPVCGGRNLRSRGRLTYYDTECEGCGARFITDGYTPEEFAEEVELGAGNLDWEDLSTEQVMAMAANMDPYVAEAFRDHDLYLWINDYIEYTNYLDHGNGPGNQETADDMHNLVDVVIERPSEVLDLLSYEEMGPTERDLYDRLLAIHVRYSRLRGGSGVWDMVRSSF